MVFPWLATVAINFFPIAEWGLHVVRSSASGGCIFVTTAGSSGYGLLFYTVFSTYFPSGVMGICYLVILAVIYDEMHRKRRRSRSLRRRCEISQTLFLSFVWHCVTMYPGIVSTAFFPKQFAENVPFQLGMRWLANSFSGVNPVRFFALSAKNHRR